MNDEQRKINGKKRRPPGSFLSLPTAFNEQDSLDFVLAITSLRPLPSLSESLGMLRRFQKTFNYTEAG